MTVQRERGAWYMRFQVRGQRYHEPTGARTKAAALVVEADRIRDLLENRDDRRLRKAPTLQEFAVKFLKYYEESQVHAQNTKDYYNNGWRLLKEHAEVLVHRRLTDIWSSDLDTITFPHSAGNANNALRTLQRMLNMAAELKYMQAAPTIHLRKENMREAIIEETWLEDLLLEMASPTLRDFMIVMLDSGPRPDECSRMRREDIRWTQEEIYIPKGKTPAARRFIPLSTRMADMLRERLARHNSPWVFPSQELGGDPQKRARAQEMAAAGMKPAAIARALGVVRQTACNYLKPPTKTGTRSASGHVMPDHVGGKLWSEMLERAQAEIARRGLPPLSEGLVLYSCRHTFATHFLNESGDIGQLSRILGHQNIQTTMRYVHRLQARKAAAIVNKRNERKLSIVRKSA